MAWALAPAVQIDQGRFRACRGQKEARSICFERIDSHFAPLARLATLLFPILLKTLSRPSTKVHSLTNVEP